MNDTRLRIDPSRNPILANLPGEAAVSLLHSGVRKCAVRGDILVREGDAPDFLLFVLEGEVAIFKGEVEIDRQPAGGVLGEMGVLTGQPRSATVKCVTDVRMIEVAAADFLALLDGYPQVLRSVVQALVRKFEATQGRRAEQVGNLERATDILSKCVSEEVLNAVLRHRTPEQLLNGTVEQAAILFIDIKGFSAIAETTPVEQLLAALNDHLGVIVDSVAKHNGTIVNFIGDAVLAVFNVPVPMSHPNVAALNCYLHCCCAMRDLQAKRRATGRVCFELGAGINHGSVVAGAIGSRTRFSYSVLGDEVNLAARLESLTRQYPVEIIISEASYKGLSAGLAERCLHFDRVRVKGRQTPVNLYTLAEMSAEERRAFADALALYLGGQFAQASSAFKSLRHPLAAHFVDRCDRLAESPPAIWDGCYSWQTK